MPDTLGTLKKILNNDILLPPPDDKGTLRIKEQAPEAKIKTLDLILDLKSDKPKPRKTDAQLKNSRAFVTYILSLLDTHYPADAVPDPRFDLAIVTTRTRKGSTYKPNEAQPEERLFRLVNPTQHQGDRAKVHFGKLVGV